MFCWNKNIESKSGSTPSPWGEGRGEGEEYKIESPLSENKFNTHSVIQRSFHFNSNEESFRRAKALRKDSTSAEKLFWRLVKNRQFENLKFRRQHPIGSFIVDFYCHEKRLVIELDGSVHEDEFIKQYDKRREQVLKSFGLIIVRFENGDIIRNLDLVIGELREVISIPSPRPSPKGEGGPPIQ